MGKSIGREVGGSEVADVEATGDVLRAESEEEAAGGELTCAEEELDSNFACTPSDQLIVIILYCS